MSTMEVGKKLVDLCRQGKFSEAMNALYAPNIVSVEAHGDPSGKMPQRMEGIQAVRGKAEWWEQNHQVHSVHVDGPWPHGDRFIVRFRLDVTAKAGPHGRQTNDPRRGRPLHREERQNRPRGILLSHGRVNTRPETAPK